MVEVNAHPNMLKLEISKIKVREDRGRTDFKRIEGLAESIKEKGLVHPIVVTENTEDDSNDKPYVLIAGERRLRAVISLGWTEVPCIHKSDLPLLYQKELELDENLQREDLAWPEQITLMQQIDEVKREIREQEMDENPELDPWTKKDTANHTGVSHGTATNQINFAKDLDRRPDIKERIKHLPYTVARKEYNRILESERMQRLHESGYIELSTDVKYGDAKELLKELEDESIDLILTDPPFGIPVIEKQRGKDRGTDQSYTTTLQEGDNLGTEEVRSLINNIIPHFARVLKPSSHFYIFFAFELYEHLINTLTNNDLVPNPVPLIWFKGKTTAPFRGYDYSPCYEPIIFGYKPPREKRLSKPCKTVLEFSPVPNNSKKHNFEKPQELLSFLIEQSTYVGNKVLDPFAGSGSTIVASKVLGRNAVGFESNQDHFNRCQLRLIETPEKEIKDESKS